MTFTGTTANGEVGATDGAPAALPPVTGLGTGLGVGAGVLLHAARKIPNASG
ncbi:hypothetical protein [Gemmatimonas sp.]|uniref:hypothetical protein n=1 Tax=Gemmatimonas sp. TaxID=1962908 RepID=UPI0037C1A495